MEKQESIPVFMDELIGMEVEEIPLSKRNGGYRKEKPLKKISQIKSKRKSKRKSIRKPKIAVSHRDWTHGAKGWGQVKPSSIGKRRVLRDLCGPKCFLKPKDHKFPICQGLEHNKNKCVMDCRGVLAAKIRGAQWKYKKIVSETNKLGKKLGCRWAK